MTALTTRLLDVASYQGDLSPADVARAGFDAVNLKVSHGLTGSAVHPNVAGWALEARALNLGVSTFHYLTASAPGADQAEYAYARITDMGLQYGTAHQLDVEATPAPALAEVRAYLARMTVLLARPVALYTGDWWWQARPGWNVTDLAPYLWAAPNGGYLTAYPGDTSPQWAAGYGGWATLSVMQYAVAPLVFPDGSRGTINVSKSAIRDATVWRDLTLGRPGMSYAPESLKAARVFYMDTLKAAGFPIDPLAVGIVGDDSHAATGTSYHLGKDALSPTSYSIVESARDKNGLTDAASAIDLGWFAITVGGKTHNLRTFSVWLVGQCRAGAADTADIREVIYSDDGVTVKRWDRLGKRTTGDSSHLVHTHLSRFRDAENSPSFTTLLTRYFTEIGVIDMALTDDDKTWIAGQLKALTTQNPFGSGGGTHSPIGDAVLNSSYPKAAGADRTYVWQNFQALHAALASDLAADQDAGAALAALAARPGVDANALAAQLAAALAPHLPASATVDAETLQAAFRQLFTGAV